MAELKVSSKSNPGSVAGAIAASVKENGYAEIVAIGGGAVNQAVKAVAIARGFVISSGIDLIAIPYFKEVRIHDEDRTAMVLRVENRGR